MDHSVEGYLKRRSTDALECFIAEYSENTVCVDFKETAKTILEQRKSELT